ncbi:hypothetical protein [Lapidilactobacillus bayanensis]|uniref:hypothetical protein n=1 Tax=Lapidilactobacillus bayanensis TaxID=2485998 RepID=UPI000F77E41D|nr:hypothetical protein [Lapidilactobacillus bayanensis]
MKKAETSQEHHHFLSNDKLPTSGGVTFLFWLLSSGWFYLSTHICGTWLNLNDATMAVFCCALFACFYPGYLVLLSAFRGLGYHPKPESIELGGGGKRISVPVFTIIDAPFKQLLNDRSRSAKVSQLAFNLTKFVCLLVLAYFTGYNLFSFRTTWQFFFAIGLALAMTVTNMALSWLFVHVFGLKIVAKEYNRPIFG